MGEVPVIYLIPFYCTSLLQSQFQPASTRSQRRLSWQRAGVGLVYKRGACWQGAVQEVCAAPTKISAPEDSHAPQRARTARRQVGRSSSVHLLSPWGGTNAESTADPAPAAGLQTCTLVPSHTESNPSVQHMASQISLGALKQSEG